MNEHLSSLLVSEADIASEALASSLQGLIQIGKESGTIIPTSAFMRLDRNARILVFLLGLRVASILGVATKTAVSPEEIAKVVGFDAKSVGEYASRMKRSCLSRDSDGYTVPSERIHLVCENIQNARKKIKEKI